MIYSILFKNDLEVAETGYYGQLNISVPDYFDEAQIMDEFWEEFEGLQAYIKPYFMIINNECVDLRENNNVVYIITDGTAVKIGATSNFLNRLRNIQNGNPRKLCGLIILKCKESKQALHGKENSLHRKYSKYRIENGVTKEWYNLSIMSELEKDFQL